MDKVTWRWAFYINLPLGAITIIVCVLFLHLPRPTGSFFEKIKRVDWLGTFVVAGASVAILLALSWGGSDYPWNSAIIIVLLIIGSLGFFLFGFVETFVSSEPLAPVRLFKHRTVVACLLVNVFHGMSFFALVYYIPLFYQVVEGDSATESGLKLLPLIIGVVVLAIASGQVISRTSIFSYKMYCLFGSVLMTVATGLISTIDEFSNRGKQIGYMLIGGVGIGAIIQTTLLAGQQVVDRRDVASVTSLLAFARTIGAVFGLSIFGSVFKNELSDNLDSIKDQLSQQAPFLPQLTSSNFANVLSGASSHLPPEIKALLINQFTKSFDFSFKVAISFGALVLLSSLLMGNEKPVKEKNDDDSGGALAGL